MLRQFITIKFLVVALGLVIALGATFGARRFKHSIHYVRRPFFLPAPTPSRAVSRRRTACLRHLTLRLHIPCFII
jgi:hypothetical protein